MPSKEQFKVKVERNLAMKTRDGLTLLADVYRPDSEGRFPVLLLRTPYSKTDASQATEPRFFPSRGYVTVVQDMRGRHASEGEFYPYIDDGPDGYDAVEWAAALPWSNGRVGAVGQSYLALWQYFTAVERPPHLAALCPVSGPVTAHENFFWHRGVLELAWALGYFFGMARNVLERKGLAQSHWPNLTQYMTHPDVMFSPLKRELFSHLPLRDFGAWLAEGAPYFADMLAHPGYGPYWQASDLRRRFADVNVPILHVGSWYDLFQYDTLTMFSGLRHGAMTEQARHGQKLLMGPWGHLMPYSVPTSKGAGELDFGPQALIELHEIQLRWFDHFLKGVDNGVMQEAPIRIFVMGDNRWRDENEWPLARTQYTKVYLSSGGGANSLAGDGTLSFQAPAAQHSDRYIYDPKDPVPTRGGNNLTLRPGAYDQTSIEQRKDVLVYTGESLQSDLEVTGPLTLKLFAASSAPDTDFTAKLVDVRPDGYAQNLADGIIRARFRDSLRYPTLITPGQVYEYAVDLWATSHVFKAGHRIRLEVSSSNFPRFDRNPNTGHPIGADADLETAQQTIFHDQRYPSHLLLPFIPR